MVVPRRLHCSVNNTTHGYAMGGQGNSAATSDIEAIEFSTQSYVNITTNLAVARYGLMGLNSSSTNIAFAIGGASTTVIDRFNMANNTQITFGQVLGVSDGATHQSSLVGYICGGNSSAQISKINFTTETLTAPIAGLNLVAARNSNNGVNTLTKGYVLGGNNSTEIDGILYSSETIINPSATLVGMPATGHAAVHSGGAW